MPTAATHRRQKTQPHILTLAPTEVTAPAVRYALYARKSSEEIERQALSIDSQIKVMLEVAQRDGLHIAEIRKESHSAKSSGSRPVFNQLLKDVRSGVFNGILTWDPSRLSRNAGDIGSVIDLMDQGHLAHIRTHSQKFTNNPNEKFLLMILSSQAKLENDNRGINVKRGQKTRVEMGYRPCLVPLGYLLEKQSGLGRGKVVIDPIRGPIIKQMFEHVAHQGASGRVLQQWLKEVDFTTRKGKRITLSMIYRMLRQHFYTGKFEYPQGSGNFYKGDYEPLVPQDLFDEAQKLLDMGPKREWGSKMDNFHFTRMFACGGCSSGITAEEKKKPLKDGSIKKYVYYRCTHARNLSCKEVGIREDALITQLSEIIDTIDLDELGMRMKLEEEVTRYKRFTNGVFGKESAPEILGVDVRQYAKYILREGTKDEKHELLSCLKSKMILKDGKLLLEAKKRRAK